MSASVAGSSQIATICGDGFGPVCKIAGDQFYGFWWPIDPKTPKVKFSVKVGKKSNAFSGTITVDGDSKDKDKDKDKDAEAPKL